MAVVAKRGSFVANTTTGNQAITGLGFQPSAVIFLSASLTALGGADADLGAVGVAVSPTQRWSVAWARDDTGAAANAGKRHSDAHCISLLSNGTPTVDALADLVSMDAGGFTINWSDAPASAVLIEYLALGGIGSVHAGKSQFRTTVGTQAVTGVGFVPKVLFLATAALNSVPPGNAATTSPRMLGLGAAVGTSLGAYLALGESDASNPAQSQTYQRDGRALGACSTNLEEFSIQSMDADGFTFNQGVAGVGTADYFFYLALADANLEATLVTDAQQTTVGSSAEDVNIHPAALIGFANGINTANDTSGSPSTTRDGRYAIGFRDGTSQASIWGHSADGVVADTDRAHSQTKFLRFLDGSRTVQAECDATLDAEGYTLDWTTADATARQVFVLVLGEVPVITQDLTNGGRIPSGEAFGAGRLTYAQDLTGGGAIPSAEAFGAGSFLYPYPPGSDRPPQASII